MAALVPESPVVSLKGVTWDENSGRWATTLHGQTGDTTTEFHDSLIDAVASRLKFERRALTSDDAQSLIYSLKQENRKLRERVDYLEFNLATSAFAGWQLH